MTAPYRAHDDGPLVRLEHDRPGKIRVVLTFDMPAAHVRGHLHAFDHTMRVRSGALRVVADGVESVLRAGAEMLIPAGVRHGLWSLASNTVAECEHDIRTENGALMPEAFAPDGIPWEWAARLTTSEAAA